MQGYSSLFGRHHKTFIAPINNQRVTRRSCVRVHNMLWKKTRSESWPNKHDGTQKKWRMIIKFSLETKREQINRTRIAYHQKNKEQIRSFQRKYCQNNRERVKSILEVYNTTGGSIMLRTTNGSIKHFVLGNKQGPCAREHESSKSDHVIPLCEISAQL